MKTSRLAEDRIVSLQFSPALPKGRLGVSVGVQDAFDETVTTPDYHECARSYFAAVTYNLGSGVYISGGGGTKRFRQGFGSISAPIMRGSRAMLENDGYGWNYGAAVELGAVSLAGNKAAPATLYVGLCQGKYMTWSLSFRG